MGRLVVINFWVCLLIVLVNSNLGQCKRQAVEEVTKKQLDALLKSEDYLAVFWCKFTFF